MPFFEDPTTKERIFVGNPTLNPQLTEGKTEVPVTPAPTIDGPITTDILTPSPGISVPPPPTPTSITTTAGQAEIDSFNKLIETSDTKDTDSLTFLFNKYLSASQAPASQADLYTQTLQTSGVPGLEQGLLGKQGTLRTAQSKLAAINAQLEGLRAEETAVPIRIQEESLGRGRTAAGIAPLQAAELRKVALRAIPLQAQALGAQAEVFSAQGDVELAQGALKIASDRLNTLFEIKSTDATNLYNYWKDLREKVFDFATAQEKNKLAANQKADDRKFELEKDNINNAQALSIKLMENGQADLAAKVSQLDPKSATFLKDLANLQAQFKPKAEFAPGDIGEFQRLYGRQPTEAEFFEFKRRAGEAGRKPDIGVTGVSISPQGVPVDISTGKPLELAENDKKLLDAFNKIDNTINQLENVFQRASVGIGFAPFARLLGVGTKLGQKIGFTGPAVREYEALVNASVGPIARAVLGEVGVLTDKDVERAKNALPSLTDTPEESQRKIANMRQIVSENRSDFFARLGVSGVQNLQTPESLRDKYKY